MSGCPHPRPAGHDLEALALRQGGAITRQQALACGVSARSWSRRVAGGGWRRLLPGVAVLPNFDQGALTRGWAALLAYGDRATLSHCSAAALWGWPVGSCPDLHVTFPPGRHPRHAPGVRIHRSVLPAADRTRWQGLPVTMPLRTLIDTAAHLAPDEAVVTADAACRQMPELLAQTAAALPPGRRGRRRALRALELVDPGAESPPETELRLLLRRAGLPPPQTQLNVFLDGGFVTRADLGYRQPGVLLFVDGWEFHREAKAFYEDRRRRTALAAAGYTVLVFTPQEVRLRPDRVAGAVRTALARQPGAGAVATSR
ncbi:MAG: hypothetical protein ACYDB7_13240 [Mycobacteriales bacterium]